MAVWAEWRARSGFVLVKRFKSKSSCPVDALSVRGSWTKIVLCIMVCIMLGLSDLLITTVSHA